MQVSSAIIPTLESSSCKRGIRITSDAEASAIKWLLKLQQSNDGTMRALNPFSNNRMPELTAELPKVLNLENIRVTELAKVYSILYMVENRVEVYARKALLISSTPNCEYAVWVVDHKGQLGHYKSGDADWTSYDLANDFCDIIRFKDRYYSVDDVGTVVMFDDSLKPTLIPKPASAPCGRWKYLIESGGKLFLVVLIRNGDNLSEDKFRIYKLNMNGLEWEELKGLKNQLLFLGLDCSFLVPAGDLIWGEGSWVFMAEGDVFGGLLGRGIGEGKDLGNGKLTPMLIAYPQYGTIFWPPPSWSCRLELP